MLCFGVGQPPRPSVSPPTAGPIKRRAGAGGGVRGAVRAVSGVGGRSRRLSRVPLGAAGGRSLAVGHREPPTMDTKKVRGPSRAPSRPLSPCCRRRSGPWALRRRDAVAAGVRLRLAVGRDAAVVPAGPLLGPSAALSPGGGWGPHSSGEVVAGRAIDFWFRARGLMMHTMLSAL